MATHASQLYRQQVLDALTDVPAPPREVYARLRMGAPRTIRHVLVDLCREGLARCQGDPCSRLYWKDRVTP